MTKSRTIAVVTGSRAEFGLLAPVMRAIADHARLRLRTVVTGVHLSGGTWREVAAAGFAIDARVAMQRRGQVGRAADVAALGRGVAGLGAELARWQPDLVLVLGDRLEALAAACAASVGGHRLAHVHGGDRAEGVADEAMRHAISKLAQVHFVASALSRKRLIRMGEASALVFQVGSPAVDGLRAMALATDDELRGLGLDAARPFVVVAQHPIGASDAQEKRWMLTTLAATRGWQRLVIAPNADPGSRGVRAALGQRCLQAIEHLPRPRFVALLRRAGAIVGNSSAGLIEAAVLGIACVNVGPRQAGREKPGNVIDCDYGEVEPALARATRLNLRRLRHPYGRGDAGRRIADLLATLDLDAIPLRKQNAY